MARNKKAALNQNPVIEPIKEEIEKTPIEEPTQLVVDGEKLMENIGTVDHPDLFAGDGKEYSPTKDEDELPKVEFSNEPIEIIIPVEEEAEEVEEVQQLTITKPSQAQLAKLSKAGLRWYQRTGMLPK